MSRVVGVRPSIARGFGVGLALAASLSSISLAGSSTGPQTDPRIAARFAGLSRDTRWTPTAAIKVGFKTFHPQGMVRIGETFFVSSVEVRTPPKRLSPPSDGHDRDTGAGVGHLFKIDAQGRLLADLILGEGSIYHPGGIDFDGRSIWVPVAEYRPDSRSIVYRVDPATMTAKAAFRFDDHLGGVAFDRDHGRLHAVSWGSRRFYTWRVGPNGRVQDGARPKAAPNPSHYIDYQDCHFVGAGRMLCSGLATYETAEGEPVSLGGMDLVDLKTGRPVWQVPIALRSPTGRPMTENPFFVEATTRGLRAWFMPDDDGSTLYAFETVAP